jgi:glucose/arabinose dehydrogenase
MSMMRRGSLVLVGALLVSACAAAESRAREAVASYRFQPTLRVATPLHVAAPRSEPGKLYVVNQVGVIRVAVNGRLRTAPFLDIRGRVLSGGEQGLLSVAFHPGYATNKRFYVDYTDRLGDTRVVEYRANRAGTAALPGSRRQLLFVKQPYANHNGGQLAFGPDGKLYVGMGDGGSGGDPDDRSQNMSQLLGKLLRLDVAQARPAPEIAALGLRNPWRFSFDRANGDLYVGDVGQGSWEEIDYVPRAQLGELANFGWDVYEGRARYEDKQPNSQGRLVFPVEVYDHDGGSCSVTGGFVYRGSAVPEASGRYFYGDYCSGAVWSLRVEGGGAVDVRREPFNIPGLSSFGEDARGELYATSLQGRVFKLTR